MAGLHGLFCLRFLQTSVSGLLQQLYATSTRVPKPFLSLRVYTKMLSNCGKQFDRASRRKKLGITMGRHLPHDD